MSSLSDKYRESINNKDRDDDGSFGNYLLSSVNAEDENLGLSQDSLKTVSRQTRDKPKTNLRQTKDKLETNPKTVLRHSSDEKNMGQTKDKLETNLRHEFDIYSITGAAKSVVRYIYDTCKQNLNNITPPVYISHMNDCIESYSIGTIRKTIQRLINAGILIRNSHKDGNGGWTRYELPKYIYDSISNNENKLETNIGQTRDSLETNLRQTDEKHRTKLETNAPYNNKENINKDIIISLNTEGLKRHKIQFGRPQTLKVQGMDISEESAQDSINAFVHDLDSWAKLSNGQYEKKGNIGYFMWHMLNHGEYVAHTKGFETIEEMAKREHYENLKRKKEDREKMDDLIRKEEFETWYQNISIDDLKRLPGCASGHKKNEMVKKTAYGHFLNSKGDVS